jgi:hypothetical protein
MDFLGHVFSQKDMGFNPKSIQVIKGWQSLAITKRVRSFLGLTNFYKKFIRDFFMLAKPFINLLKKEFPFEW